SSLDDIREAARAARLHWGVENGLHWHLDAVFGADKSKETGKGAPTQLQALKSIASNALRFGTGFFKKGKYTINTLIEELSMGTAQIAKFLRFFSLGGRRREAA
ncbi:MAG: hypothetical protein LBU32_15015, partial [Clostridiales bacterium]|nr:hypothetical protein [Clostridiales bacterium]